MHRTVAGLVLLAATAALSAQIRPPARPARKAAATPVVAAPAASTDIDAPTPLTTKTVAGRGTKKKVSYYYRFDSDAGTLALTGTGKNSSSASTNALWTSVSTIKADRVCYISLGNQTKSKTETVSCTVDKAQPLILRIDLTEDTIDYAVTLDGPIHLAAPGGPPPAAVVAVMGPGSNDIDVPTPLTGSVIQGQGNGRATSYFYALTVGAGDLTITADGKNRSSAVADALHVRLQDLRTEPLCDDVSIGNATRDERKVGSCRLTSKQPAILRVNLDPNTIDWRVKVDGAVAFDPFTLPKTVTIAINEKVLFESGKATLKPEARQTLHETGDRMKNYAEARITIGGHTDNVGGDAANQKLSDDRASAVRDFLVREEGIPAARLDVKGYGKSRPVADNSTDAGRARNRRVEIVIEPR